MQRVLEHAGYRIEREFDLRSREVSQSALESGQIDLKPEYLSSLLLFLDSKAQGSSDPTDVARQVGQHLGPKGITVLTPSRAQDMNQFVANAETVVGIEYIAAAQALTRGALTVLSVVVAMVVSFTALSLTARVAEGDFEPKLPISTHRSDEIGELARAFAGMTDSLRQNVAKLEQTQAQLVQSEKLASLGEMAASIAHELRNPLAVDIQGVVGGGRQIVALSAEADPVIEPRLRIVADAAHMPFANEGCLVSCFL